MSSDQNQSCLCRSSPRGLECSLSPIAFNYLRYVLLTIYTTLYIRWSLTGGAWYDLSPCYAVQRHVPLHRYHSLMLFEWRYDAHGHFFRNHNRLRYRIVAAMSRQCDTQYHIFSTCTPYFSALRARARKDGEHT